MTYAVGDKVDVWDGDKSAWVSGTVETVGDDLITVHTMGAAYGFPLIYGVPTSVIATLVRSTP